MIDDKVDFCRIEELEVGDLCLINGVWRDVYGLTKDTIKYRNAYEPKNYKSMSRKSKQFVQVVRYGKTIK